jgi:CRP/FNR family cyclic AMP-dependent transcriptional regulator
MDNKQKSELLAGIDAFEGLGEEEFELLGAHFRHRTFRRGEELIREGETVRELSVVISGSVEVLLPEEGTEVQRFTEVKLDTIGPGQYLGEYSVLDMRPASATAVALEEVEVLQIGAADLQTVLNRHCEIARCFYRNLTLILIDRLRRTNLELDLFTAV